MEVVYKKSDLENYLVEAVQASSKSPVLLDGFLNQAIEMDIEAVCDGEEVVIGGYFNTSSKQEYTLVIQPVLFHLTVYLKN